MIQSVIVGQETYGNGYGLWNGALSSPLEVSVNIYEGPGRPLSDTWHLFGSVGDQAIHIPFQSDFGSPPLLPLPNPTQIIFENGNWQTVAEFDVSNGDHYVWQFRSDVDSVPDAGSSLALMSIGLASLFGVARRSFKTVA